ncbi:alpha/beta fold hydrolase [Streptomyces sp. NPDC056149]|uniref:alpha/beta fold hydrolase n=1 Tax=Streptomyces sp. NPDC056149 TaxID=3345728 RepID=UPI0035D5304C
METMEVEERLIPLTLRDVTYACRILTPRRRYGTEPLVLIGGALQDMYSWPRLERRLTAHTTLMLMDLPGTGNADDPAASAGIDVLVEAALHAIDHLGADRVNILGASYGTPIAYRLAQSHPDRVARLLLAGAAPPARAAADRGGPPGPRTGGDDRLPTCRRSRPPRLRTQRRRPPRQRRHPARGRPGPGRRPAHGARVDAGLPERRAPLRDLP